VAGDGAVQVRPILNLLPHRSLPRCFIQVFSAVRRFYPWNRILFSPLMMPGVEVLPALSWALSADFPANF